MKIVDSKSVEGLVVLTNVAGDTFLHFDQRTGPSVVKQMEEATPMPEPLAQHFLQALEASREVFFGFPEVESFLARAVVRHVEAELVLVDISEEIASPDSTSDDGPAPDPSLFEEDDLAPNRVLH